VRQGPVVNDDGKWELGLLRAMMGSIRDSFHEDDMECGGGMMKLKFHSTLRHCPVFLLEIRRKLVQSEQGVSAALIQHERWLWIVGIELRHESRLRCRPLRCANSRNPVSSAPCGL
jgi:hypothetical protein